MIDPNKPLLSFRQQRALNSKARRIESQGNQSPGKLALRFLQMSAHNIVELRRPGGYISDLTDEDLCASFATRFSVEVLCRLLLQSKNGRIRSAARHVLLTHHAKRSDAMALIARGVSIAELLAHFSSQLRTPLERAIQLENDQWRERDRHRAELALMNAEQLRQLHDEAGGAYAPDLLDEAMSRNHDPRMGHDVDHWRFQID